MYRARQHWYTFECGLQKWLETILELCDTTESFHSIAMSSPAAVLPQFLRISNEYNCVAAGIVAVCALVNIGACQASNILECFQQFNPEGSPDFEEQVLRGLLHLVGPRGPYLSNDLRFARQFKKGPVHEILKKNAIKRWSAPLFALVARRMWYAFLQHALRPESGYVQRVLLPRLSGNESINK